MKKAGMIIKKIPAVYIALIIFITANAIMNPKLLSESGLKNFLIQTMPLLMAVLAQATVMLVGELDIAIGAHVSLVTVILAVTMADLGFALIILALLISIAIGALTGLIVAYLKISGIVVTLAVSMILSGLALLILPVPGGKIIPAFAKVFNGTILGIPNLVLILVGVLAILGYIKRSKIGFDIYATGGNYYSAFASGIRVKRAKLVAFIISSLLCCISGMILSSKIMSGDATVASSYSITSIAGAVLGGVSLNGGVGNMQRAAAGALIISIITNVLFFLQIESFWQYAVQGAILIIAILLSNLNKKA